MDNEYEFFELVIWVLVIILISISKIITQIMHSKNKENNEKSEINFDEFSNIEEIRKQEIKERKELEYEAEVLEQVYNDSYNESLYSSFENRRFYRKENDNTPIYASDVIKAHLDACDNVEKVKKDLYNFRFLDSVEMEEEKIAEGNPISALRENGNDFDIELFKKWSRQIFGCIKSGSEEQLKIVKKFMTEELYDRLQHQIKQFSKDGLEFVTEDLLIEKCYLYDYGKSVTKEEIKILINAKMKEYIIQKSNNEIIRGNNKKSYDKKIIMTFLKQKKGEIEGIIHNCPNCGAEVTQTEFGKCRYCNTLLLPIRYNWTLTKFETM